MTITIVSEDNILTLDNEMINNDNFVDLRIGSIEEGMTMTAPLDELMAAVASFQTLMSIRNERDKQLQ